MEFSKTYKCLTENVFKKDVYNLIPIRYKDRYDIMKWRNGQIYHLRQIEPLTKEDQDNYFKNVVSKLFNEDKPSQILFSFLKNERLIGYGGLVHINWVDKHAEISFIMNTVLEKDFFVALWKEYLQLIEKVAFLHLNFVKIYTYAFDLRPKLYEALSISGYFEEARLKNHCIIEGGLKDVLIHSKMNIQYFVTYRKATLEDLEIMFKWANDPISRANSFESHKIDIEEHKKWFNGKVNNSNSFIYIAIDDINNEKIGVVRYELKEQNAFVGIHIDKSYRGKKLAGKLLKETAKLYFKTNNRPILAYIKNENKLSIKAFERADYGFYKNDIVNKIDCMVYKLSEENGK